MEVCHANGILTLVLPCFFSCSWIGESTEIGKPDHEYSLFRMSWFHQKTRSSPAKIQQKGASGVENKG
jgi:hypothetical protein